MGNCAICYKKIKFSRNCPALNATICSSCCGSKRGAEIQCINNCNYLVEGLIKDNRKHITQIVKESFNFEFDDIFRDGKIVELAAPFEQFIFDNYYGHIAVTDEFMSECYTKMYYSLDGKENVYSFNEIEKPIFDEFKRIAEKTKTPIDIQKQILIRMMKSVSNMSGSIYGNRMYLELLRNNFTGTGFVAEFAEDII